MNDSATALPTDWRTTPLKSVAAVRFSSVDKKSTPRQQAVRLCNYIDVYTREYIRGIEPFMAATASDSEISQFGIRCGDVLITKDSETPDDIGVPSVIVCDPENLVCGYHLALLRPDRQQVDPVFLAKQLRHHRLARYFGRMCNGLTRYGLPTAAVENAVLWLPSDVLEQTAIGVQLRKVDEAIQQTSALIAKLKNIKAGLLHDLLTWGIDKNGHVRANAPTRGQVPISAFAHVNPPVDTTGLMPLTSVSFVPMEDVSEQGQWVNRQKREWRKVKTGYTAFQEGDVLFAKITPCMENGKGFHASGTINGHGYASTEFHVLRAKGKNCSRFVFWQTMNPALRLRAAARMTGSAGQLRVPSSFFDTFTMPYFDPDEQSCIADRLDGIEARIQAEDGTLRKLTLMKQGLMHDLLTGRVRVAMKTNGKVKTP